MPNSIEFLAWDSEFFNRRVGKLYLKSDTTLDEHIQSAYRQRYELLYIYSPVPIAYSLIRKYNLLDVGGHITFARSLRGDGLEKIERTMEIDQFQQKTLSPELLEIAFLSGHISRFKIDSSLPAGSFERLYERWLTNSLRNSPRSGIYVYHYHDRVAGLITSEIHGTKCTIGLLGVSRPYQGRGVASKLIRHVLEICNRNRVSLVEVKTQLTNESARALYLKNSFTERERSFLYHVHNVVKSTS